jgi:hypothetical protein
LDARDALLRPLLLDRTLTGFCLLLSSVACRLPGSFEDALLLPLLLERRPWSVEFSPCDGSAVPKSVAESRLRPPLLLDLARVLLECRPWPIEFSPDGGSVTESRLRPPLLLDRAPCLFGLSSL